MATSHSRQPTRSWLRAAAALAVPPLTAALFVATPAAPTVARAATPSADNKPSATSTDPPPPTCDPNLSPDCPAASPSIIVISPVPMQSPSPQPTPSYLVGIPSPSVDPGVNNGGTPIPLGGGFNAFPSPISGGPVSAVSDNSGAGGPPLPLLLIGVLVLVGVAASILFALAPSGLRFPEPGGRPRAKPIARGSESPELMVMHPSPPRARSRRPGRNP